MQERNIANEFIDKHPLLKSLIKWYQQNELEDQKRNHFLTSFVDTLVFNLTQSSNNFRYSDTIKEFAACLHILGGKQLYDFVRLNLPGAIPSMTTIIDLINKSDTTLAEAEFKFQSLQQFDSGFGFCSKIPRVFFIKLNMIYRQILSSGSQHEWLMVFHRNNVFKWIPLMVYKQSLIQMKSHVY